MASTPRDSNRAVALAGVSTTDATKTAVVYVNPVTNAVIVQLA